MADSEIRLRFAASGIRQIRDDMRATGQEGTAAFEKIQAAVAKGATTLKGAQKDLESYEAALKAMGHTDTTTFAQLNGVNRTFNPTQSGVPTYQGPQATAYDRGASAGQANLAQRTLALTDAINPLAVAQRKFSAAETEANALLAAGTIKETEHAAAVALARKELNAAEEAAKKMAAGVALNSQQLMELGHSARAMADSLIAGANPLRTIGQEAPRIVQALGEGKGGLTGVLGMLRGAIMGPIGLMLALGGAIAGGVKATLDYRESQETLQRVLLGAGRAYGGNTEALEKTAESAGRAGNVTVEAARQMEGAFLSTGRIGADQLGGLIALSRDFAAAMGLKAPQATAELAKAFEDPARGADELNQRLHFLSDAELDAIRTMAEAGDRAGAQALMMDKLGGAVSGAAGHLDFFKQALHNLSVPFADTYNWLGKIVDRFKELNGGELAQLKYELASMQNAPLGGDMNKDRIAELKKQIADIEQAPARQKAAQDNETSDRAGDVVDKLHPEIAAVRDLRGELAKLQAEAGKGWKGLDPDKAKQGQHDIEALTRALRTYIPERQKAIELAKIEAQLATRPGSAERDKLLTQQRTIQLAGDPRYTDAEADSLIGSAGQKGYNRGQRVDQRNANKAASEATKAADAQREWNAAVADGVAADKNAVEAENKVIELRQRGAQITAAEAKAYIDQAKAKDAAATLKKQLDEAKLQREVTAALGGTTHETQHLEQAQELLARAIEGKIPLTEQDRQHLLALGQAADEAAEKMKALERARSAMSEAATAVREVAPKPVDRQGKYDPQIDLTQWLSQRQAVYAAFEAKIRETEAQSVAAGGENERQAAQNTAEAIAELNVAYATENAKQLLDIKKKAADEAYQHEKELQDQLNSHIASAAEDVGSAVMKLTQGAKAGDVGRNLAKSILQQILQTLLGDPLVALIKQALQNLTNPGSTSFGTGAGGIGGLLGGAARFLMGGTGLNLSMGPQVTPLPTDVVNSFSDPVVTPAALPTLGFADGTNSTPDNGLYWVGENGPEIMGGGGRTVMSNTDSMNFIDRLHSAAGSASILASAAASGGGPGHTFNIVNNNHTDATGADPAQLQRMMTQQKEYQRQEPARIAGYLRAARLK